MVAPLVIAGLSGLGISAGSNLYTQGNQRRLYRAYARSYRQLDSGYMRYLARRGIKANPNRRMLSYYGHALSMENNLANSYIGSIGTAAGTLGAGAMLSGGLFRSPKKGTNRWL